MKVVRVRGAHSILGAVLPGMILAAALTLVGPGPAAANPLDNFGFGSRAVAMGGAVAALADDFSSAYYNPAGLTATEELTVSLGYFFTDPHLNINGDDINEDQTRGLVFGFASPMELFGVKIVSGLSVHIPDKRLGRSLALPWAQPRFIMYSERSQRIAMLFPWAFELTEWLSVGAAIQMLVDTGGGPDFTLYQAGVPEYEGLRSEGSISTIQKPVFFPNAGLRLGPFKGFCFGLAYKGQSESQYEIPLTVRISPLEIKDPFFDAITIMQLEESLVDMYQWMFVFFAPHQITLGLAYDFGDKLKLAFDLTWQDWSDFNNPAPEGATMIEGGLRDLIGQTPNFRLPVPGYHDVWVPAVGIEYLALRSEKLDLFVRAGYVFRETPVPDQSMYTGYLDSDTHIPSIGLGFVLRDVTRVLDKPIGFDIHYQQVVLSKRYTLRLDPASDPYGDLEAEGAIYNIGCTLTVRF